MKNKAPKWRKIKNAPKQAESNNKEQITNELFIKERLKAFLTDLFMIYTPLLYVALFMLGSGKEFRESQGIVFICFMCYAIIYSALISKSAQTPGLKYANLKLVRDIKPESSNLDSSIEYKVGFFRAFFRLIIWAATSSIILGFLSPWVSKKHAFWHDTLSGTKIIKA